MELPEYQRRLKECKSATDKDELDDEYQEDLNNNK